MRNDDWMSAMNLANAAYFSSQLPHAGVNATDSEQRIHVDKATHRIRFENETESSVVIVIEPKQ